MTKKKAEKRTLTAEEMRAKNSAILTAKTEENSAGEVVRRAVMKGTKIGYCAPSYSLNGKVCYTDDVEGIGTVVIDGKTYTGDEVTADIIRKAAQAAAGIECGLYIYEGWTDADILTAFGRHSDCGSCPAFWTCKKMNSATEKEEKDDADEINIAIEKDEVRQAFKAAVDKAKARPEIKAMDKELEELRMIGDIFEGKSKIKIKPKN